MLAITNNAAMNIDEQIGVLDLNHSDWHKIVSQNCFDLQFSGVEEC